MNDSRTLRQRLVQTRNQLNESELASAASAIVEPVLRAVPDTPGTVAGYLAYGGELNVVSALEALIERGWSVVLPVCGPNATMEFCPWTPGDALSTNHLGIEEPVTDPVALTKIDVVLVPGVGFETSGSRIGHGMGFYDRYFARCAEAEHDPLRIGMAHDVQVVELPKSESWDVPMHLILTPTKVLDIGSCA